jgi:hypothetical protein
MNFCFARWSSDYHRAFNVLFFQTMEFWLSRSLSRTFLSHNGILAITEPFMNFFFHTIEFWVSRSLSRTFLSHNGILAIKEPFTNFFFHMMEFWLSRSLSRTFSFTRWNSGYHGAFHELFLSHDGILAITEPFTNLFFHTMEFWLSRSLSRTFSFTRWNSGYHGAFHELFAWLSPWDSWFGGNSFHIYHKEYLHRIHLVKNLASWFRAPFARKRVRSSLF